MVVHMNKKKNLSFSKYYTFVTVLSPIMMMYNFGIATVTFLDAAIILGYVAVFFYHPIIKKTKLNVLMFFYTVMLFINLSVTGLYRDYEFMSVAFRTIRLVVYLLWGIWGGIGVFNGELAMKIWKAVCVFATTLLIVQYIALYLFNVSIPGYLPFLDLARDELIEFTENLYASSSARPRSIFAEPSQYGIYLTGFLMLAFLNTDYIISKRLIIFLYFGMILSASTSAFLGVFLSFVFLCAFRLSQKKHIFSKANIWYLLLGIMVIGVVLVYNWQHFGALLEKIMTRLPASLNNRLSGWEVVIDRIHSEGLPEQMFGFGMDADLIDSLDWTSSILKLWFYYGYIGIAIILFGLFWFLLQKKRSVTWLVISIVLIGFFTELLVSNWLVLFVPFIQFIDRGDKQQEVSKCG